MSGKLIFNRIFAALFDFLVLSGVVFIISMPAIACLLSVFANPTTSNDIALFISSFISGTISLVLIVFYTIIFPAIFNGQTLGKIIFNIKIRKINGSEVDFKAMFLRNTFHLLVLFSTLCFSFVIDLITLCLTKDHLTFYDIIASTCIIDV